MKKPTVASFCFTIPWSALCSDNRKFISRQFILSSEYRESKKLIGQFALAAARKAKWEKYEGPIALEVAVREPDGRRRDLNWSKNAKDGISACEGVWWDDSQVRWELWRFVEPHDKGTAGATVTITALDSFIQLPYTTPHDTAAMGRTAELQPEAPARLQRQRRVRGGATAAVEPTSAGDGESSRRRHRERAPRQRRTGGTVPRRQKPPADAPRDVHAPPQAPDAP